MFSGGEKPAVLTQFICKLRGGSQSILARASDDQLYIAKFANNPQGQNLLFNESMGTELYHRSGLPVPLWRPLAVTRQFVTNNPGCWIETPDGLCPPEIGICFGSLYLGAKEMQVFEILPGNSFIHVQNRGDFWLAWLLDICARHTDNRQALFHGHIGGNLTAVFIDHGHMFGSPNGDEKPDFLASQYYHDPRIYPNLSAQLINLLQQAVAHIDIDGLWARVLCLPEEWITHSGLRNLAGCLDRLAKPAQVENLTAIIRDLRYSADGSNVDDDTNQESAPSVFSSAITSGGQAWPACA